MKHLHLPQALTLGLLSLCLAAPLSASAKTKPTPSPLQCEKDGRMQACEDSPSDASKPRKALAFKAQSTDVNGAADQASKKKKKSKKAKKKAKRQSVAE